MCIRDRGYRKEKSDNAIKSASTPIMDSLWHAYPHTLISASGSDVGLPDGQMGNSEVGHLTIGSGRIIQQELVRISNIIKNNQLDLVNELKEIAHSLKKKNQTMLLKVPAHRSWTLCGMLIPTP